MINDEWISVPESAQELEFGECATGNLAFYTAEVPTSRLDDLARGS